MISTVYPFGAINESEIRYLVSFDSRYYLVDNYCNNWFIDFPTFNQLSDKGYQVKEKNL